MFKKILLFSFVLFLLVNCSAVKPKDFTYTYNNEYTGLDTLININGYYMVQRECDTEFLSVFMFYTDGLLVFATGTDLSEVAECFVSDKKSIVCDYPSWGIYRIEGDIIKTQSVTLEGMTSINIFRDYRIMPDKSLINIADYVYPENSKIGYLRNYPSFKENACPVKAVFHSSNIKRDSSKCPFLKLKWFKEQRLSKK